jgi:hypothetical protein
VFASRNLTGRQQLVWVLTSGTELRRAIGRANLPDFRSRLTRALPPALLGTIAGLGYLVAARMRSVLGRGPVRPRSR